MYDFYARRTEKEQVPRHKEIDERLAKAIIKRSRKEKRKMKNIYPVVFTKTVRKNVTIPNWLNYEAEHAGINVSRVLQEALMNVLNLKRRF